MGQVISLPKWSSNLSTTFGYIEVERPMDNGVLTVTYTMFGSYSCQFVHPLYGIKRIDIKQASTLEDAKKLARKLALDFIEQQREKFSS